MENTTTVSVKMKSNGVKSHTNIRKVMNMTEEKKELVEKAIEVEKAKPIMQPFKSAGEVRSATQQHEVSVKSEGAALIRQAIREASEKGEYSCLVSARIARRHFQDLKDAGYRISNFSTDDRIVSDDRLVTIEWR